MSVVQTFETTIVSSDVEHPAQAFVVPKRTLEQMPSASLDDISEVLGLRLGVEVPSADLLPTVFFASMAGRIQPFDAGSFERWARQMKAEDPRAEFARQLAFDDLLPVESSPLEKVSLASLTARGPAYVIGGIEAVSSHPFTALGVVVLGEFGAVVVGVIRGFGASAALAARYHTRRFLRVPPDWYPPEDH